MFSKVLFIYTIQVRRRLSKDIKPKKRTSSPMRFLKYRLLKIQSLLNPHNFSNFGRFAIYIKRVKYYTFG